MGAKVIRAKRTFAIGTIEAKENLTWNHYSIESRGVSLNHFNIGTTARRSQENFTTAMRTACRNQWNLSKQRNESALKNHSRAPENPNNKDPRRLHKAHRNCKLQEPREPMEPLLFQRSLCFLREGNWRDQEIQGNCKNQGATGTWATCSCVKIGLSSRMCVSQFVF